MKLGSKSVVICVFAAVAGWYLRSAWQPAIALVPATGPIAAGAAIPEPVPVEVSAPVRQTAVSPPTAADSSSVAVQSQSSPEQRLVLARLRRWYLVRKDDLPRVDRCLSAAQLQALSVLEADTMTSVMEIARRRGDLIKERREATDLSRWEKMNVTDGAIAPTSELLGDQVSVRFDGPVTHIFRVRPGDMPEVDLLTGRIYDHLTLLTAGVEQILATEQGAARK